MRIIYSAACPLCGVWFQTTSDRAVCCSTRCRQRLYYERNRPLILAKMSVANRDYYRQHRSQILAQAASRSLIEREHINALARRNHRIRKARRTIAVAIDNLTSQEKAT